MEKKNLIRLFMFQTVHGFAQKNMLITSKIVAYKNGITTLGDIISNLVELSSTSIITVGSGAQAEYSRAQLDNKTANIINQARGYYLSVCKLDIAAKLDYPYTRLSKLSNKYVGGLTKAFIKLITPDVIALNDWGIDQNSLTTWNQVLDQYNREYVLPKNTIETRKQDNIKIRELIKKGMDHCRNVLDTSASGFKENGNIIFYNEYQAFRKLTSVPRRHGKIKFIVQDDIKQPVSNVTILQDGTSNSIVTDVNGEASLDIIYNAGPHKNLRTLYSFTITSGTRTITTGIIVIKRNQTIHRVIEMETSGFSIPAHPNKIVTITKQ